MDAVSIAKSILSLVAGVGVFLIACTMMSSNLEALGSRKMKALFAKASNNKLLGVGVGTAATVVIQSSSATSVIIVLPLTNLLVKLVTKIIPDKKVAKDEN